MLLDTRLNTVRRHHLAITLSSLGPTQRASTSSMSVNELLTAAPSIEAQQLASSLLKLSCWSWLASRSVELSLRPRDSLTLCSPQLDKLGMGAGHLPFDHPFAMSLHEVASVPSPNPSTEIATRPPVSRKDLLDALSTRDVFDKLYIDVTNRTIQAYSSSGRKRCSLKLHSSLAALEKCVAVSISSGGEYY